MSKVSVLSIQRGTTYLGMQSALARRWFALMVVSRTWIVMFCFNLNIGFHLMFTLIGHTSTLANRGRPINCFTPVERRHFSSKRCSCCLRWRDRVGRNHDMDAKVNSLSSMEGRWHGGQVGRCVSFFVDSTQAGILWKPSGQTLKLHLTKQSPLSASSTL